MNFKSNKVAKTIIAVICFCKHGILDDVKSVAASTVASLFSGLQEGVCINLRIELSSLVAVGIGNVSLWQRTYLKKDMSTNIYLVYK